MKIQKTKSLKEDTYMFYQTFDNFDANVLDAERRVPLGGMSNADKVFARAIVKRQLLVIKDLMSLGKTYPDLIDKDVTGGLYALYTLLEDNVNSIVSR